MNMISKRFVVRKSLIGKNQVITVNFKNGKSATYNHDAVYAVMKPALEQMACWSKYKSYTSSSGVPKLAREVVAAETAAQVASDDSEAALTEADANAEAILDEMLDKE